MTFRIAYLLGAILAALSASLLMGGTGQVTAAQSYTQQLRNVTQTVPAINPCLGPMVGVLTYDGVMHVSLSDNAYHVVVAVHGEALTDPADPNIPTFSGRFSEVETFNLNRQNSTTHFVVTQSSDHGLQFHITFALAVTPNGATLDVFNVTCGS